MPSTVADIFAAAGAKPAGVVRWHTPPVLAREPPGLTTGVYVVSFTDRVDSTGGALSSAPISATAVHELLRVRPELTLDGERPTRPRLTARLAEFWFPDEVILYIGLAGPRKQRGREGEVSKRVGEYYKTRLGARSPHAGGWPLKTLFCLGDLHVHYAYCDDVNAAENACIGRFAEQVSAASRAGLRDPVRLMPFANLEFPKHNRKDHGIRGARAPKQSPAGSPT
jgi:hypothetical protein